MNSIVEIVAQNANRIPDNLCVVDVKEEYTYSKFWKLVKQVAGYLIEQGVHKGESVLVECVQRAEYLICGFACNVIGAYFVPIENRPTTSRLQTILDDTEAVILFCESECDVSIKKVQFDAIFELDEYEINTWDFPGEEDTAEILYTTGTTGKSKGIEISHKNNIAIAENICYGTEMGEGNVELIPLPLSHSHGLRCCYANFFRNGTVILTDGVTNVREIYSLVKTYGIKALDLSPTAASVLLKLTRGKFKEFDGQFDYIQIGTAPLTEEIKEELCAQFPNVRLYNFYGSTESGRTCVLNFNSDNNKKFCVGFPTRNAQFIVTDDERNQIVSDKDRTGLLACAGTMNMKGYWKQPELTESVMKNGFIYTNDEGYIDENGLVYVLGRKDDVINYKGIKISPEEIEEVVKQYPGITDCACVPKKDKTAGQVPKLFLALQNENDFDKSSFVKFLEEHIDGNKVPKHFEYIDEIPRTSNGKIQRKKLME